MPAGRTFSLVLRVAAVVAVLFGAATVASGGNVLFGGGAQAAGSYVPFVVWFNFLAGFVYVAAGIGLWRRSSWAAPLAIMLAGATAVTFAALGWHIGLGGAYENRTLVAMTLRLGVWLAIAFLAMRFDLSQGRYRRA
jgi:hypothetical protein